MGIALTWCNLFGHATELFMIVGALVWDVTARARLAEAVRGWGHLHVCERSTELYALAENGLVEVVVVDMRDPWGNSTLQTVRSLTTDFPSVPVLLYWSVTQVTSRDMLDFAKAGVSELLLRDMDDARGNLEVALREAVNRRSAMATYEELAPLVPANVAVMIRYCLENGRRALTVEEVAAGLNVHRKTLVDRLSSAGLPTPSTVIAWCRLLISAKMLEDPGRSVEQVALMLDFPSGNSMRNMVKRYTGLRTGEVRENGGLRCILHAFKRELQGAGVQREAS